MPLLKRKPVHLVPLPSISSVLQAIPPPPQPDDPAPSPEPPALPPDLPTDEEQLAQLQSVLRGNVPGANGLVNLGVKGKGKSQGFVLGTVHAPQANGHGEGQNGEGGEDAANGDGGSGVQWKIWDREVFYIPETGEIFTDYESFVNRRAFLAQPLFQCEVSSKSSLTYSAALQSEQKEARQLHTRFPRQLKRAVLASVQFQVEGKLETLADKIYERFVNRFFDDEKVFVDVQGDKYLARIIRTFPPRSLRPPTSPYAALNPNQHFHPYATDLSLTMEEVLAHDDPMGYFYNVRLIEEGVGDGEAINVSVSGSGSTAGSVKGEERGDAEVGGERWGGSTMEVQGDKISRDRINFSRAMLKRFIRDCVSREAAVYSPWMVKPPIAKRYGLPTEMSDEIREGIAQYREAQMGKRKRDREERLGITHEEEVVKVEEEVKPETEEGEGGAVKKRKRAKKDKKEEEQEEVKRSRESVEREEREKEEERKRKALKSPAEDLLVEWSEEKDGAAGRIEVRPAPQRSLPFGDQFEKFLMSWSFLNVMGKPLNLSPFTLDDYEHALYHTDPYTSPVPLLSEIHACLLNTLVGDLAAGHPPVRPISLTGRDAVEGEEHGEENDMDYWEGKKGATAETLRPVAGQLAESWKLKELSPRDHRKGWEAALVGCLWDRASLETLPSYLDNVLHLTFEDKPAPTRPTWSTGPSSASAGGAGGLIPARPEKRYTSLHHTHKLDIIGWLVELVGQTEKIREFMEESTAGLTEVRKEMVEVKRELRRIRAEQDALEPKAAPASAEDEPNGHAEGAEGDVSMNGREDVEPDMSVNGHAPNGTATIRSTEHDELDSLASDDDDGDSNVHEEEEGPGQAAAARRKAMKERAAEREAEEAVRAARALKDREDARQKKAEGKAVQLEKRRLADEEEAATRRLRQLDFDFRSCLQTLRARPVGQDRFGNKVWWLDGVGSSPLVSGGEVGSGGKVNVGTGRIYLQGSGGEAEREGEEDGGESGGELEWWRGGVGEEWRDWVTREKVEERRKKEEGEGRLGRGEWGSYETVEELNEFVSWLNPRGVREAHLLKQLRAWLPEIEQGMKRRRVLAGLDDGGGGGGEEADVVRRSHRARKGGGGGGEDGEGGGGYMNWRNRRATGKE